MVSPRAECLCDRISMRCLLARTIVFEMQRAARLSGLIGATYHSCSVKCGVRSNGFGQRLHIMQQVLQCIANSMRRRSGVSLCAKCKCTMQHADWTDVQPLRDYRYAKGVDTAATASCIAEAHHNEYSFTFKCHAKWCKQQSHSGTRSSPVVRLCLLSLRETSRH